MRLLGFRTPIPEGYFRMLTASSLQAPVLDAPVYDAPDTVVLDWSDPSTIEDGVHVYASYSEIDVNALPPPAATLAPNTVQYGYTFDADEPLEERLYFRVAAFKSGIVKVSNEQSIGNPANVLYPDSPTWLFGDGEYGYLYPIPVPGTAPNYTTAAGSTLVTAYGDPIGRMEDTSGNGVDATQSTAGSRPTAGGFPFGGSVRNELIGTETMSTQVVAVTAAARTLSFKGTGTVTLTGASTAGPLVGTGANDIVSLTFTPSAGNLTLTVSGSVTEAQLELGGSRTAYQNRPFVYLVEQEGLPTVPAAYFDLTDDSVSLTLPAGTYTIVIPGNKGTWIGEGFVWAGGTFTIGPTTYTNGPANLFSNVTGRWLMGGFAIDRALTASEKVQVGRYYKARGNAGVWEAGADVLDGATLTPFGSNTASLVSGTLSLTRDTGQDERVCTVDETFGSNLWLFSGVWTSGGVASTPAAVYNGLTQLIQITTKTSLAFVSQQTFNNSLVFRIRGVPPGSPVNQTWEGVALRALTLNTSP